MSSLPPMHPFIPSASLRDIHNQLSRSLLIYPTNMPQEQQGIGPELDPFLATTVYQVCPLTTLKSNPEPFECSQVLYSNSIEPYAQLASMSSHLSISSSSFGKT